MTLLLPVSTVESPNTITAGTLEEEEEDVKDARRRRRRIWCILLLTLVKLHAREMEEVELFVGLNRPLEVFVAEKKDGKGAEEQEEEGGGDEGRRRRGGGWLRLLRRLMMGDHALHEDEKHRETGEQRGTRGAPLRRFFRVGFRDYLILAEGVINSSSGG
ncbi:uncharacterized protein A4U43_C01F1530 [Asparagus officinalis]|uniref:Uncharacterized protein n=1 Tax=Asparagus officinalis TaxID=4686 RepID=A0A5P1FPQ7_ASPOF|nr:uncharacterized protein A4U43_C01F1530 [Asparagus officinalis]